MNGTLLYPEPELIGLICIGLFGLAGFFQKVLAIIEWFRTKPPMHETYATKKEVERLETHHERALADCAKAHQKIYEQIRDLAAAVHRIEGKLFS